MAQQDMYETYSGARKIIALRKLANAASTTGTKLALQVEHTLAYTSDSETTSTKDGTKSSLGSPVTEFSMENILSDDPINKLLYESATQHTKLEIWEINLDNVNEDGKYAAKYFRGICTSLEQENPADDAQGQTAEFAIDGIPTDGYVTLDDQTEEVITYAFRDLTPNSSGD